MPERGVVRVGVTAFRANLASSLRDVEEGASFILVSRGRDVARIAPAAVPAERRAGTMAGAIRMAEDFDSLPDDLLDELERGL